MVPQVVEFGAPVFVLETGNDQPAVQINAHIFEVVITEKPFPGADDAHGFPRTDDRLNKRRHRRLPDVNEDYLLPRRDSCGIV
jgi:hypothetical protein